MEATRSALETLNLSGAALSGAALSGEDLSGENLSSAALSGADLSKANLSGADLSKADLSGADLSEANLSEANLSEADLSNADLRSANLSKAYLIISRADLYSANFIGTDLPYLSSLDLGNANLSGATLHDVDFFSRADLQEADLRGATLRGADLRGATLSDADLSSADLRYTNFSNAILQGADLHDVDFSNAILHEVNFCNTDFSGAILRKADLYRANLHGANLYGADLRETDLREAHFGNAILRDTDFREANLSSADFYNADLCGADLSNTNLYGVDFRKTDLRRADFNSSRVLYANFTEARLTGACIADWQIGSSTILQSVKCDYIFRTADESNAFSGRLPVDPESSFAAEEFTQRFQIIASALETIDITFTEGIDWQAFFASFQELRQQRPNDELSIQGIERKGEAFIIRLEVPQEADKGAIETRAKQLYETQLKSLEAHYEKQLRLQGESHTVEVRQLRVAERQVQATLMEVIKTMADKQGSTYQFNNSKFGGGFAAEGGFQMGGNLNDFSQTEDLSEAANKIQQLLAQLQSQSVSEDAAAEALATQARQDPTLMGKLVNWGKTLGGDAAEAATGEAAKIAGGQAAKIVITKALALLGLSLI